MITAPSLEIAVLVLGLLILLIEAFATGLEKKTLAYSAIAALSAVFVCSFFLTASGPPANSAPVLGFWSFYSGDALAIFFKRFALVTTILVLIMSIDYAPVLRKFTHGATAESGLGEFYAIPILTCAGLMWMASAVDFIMIFVSLELVTLSFYVLVAYTRRNPASLEAGVKYLILSALSTGFLVYGITWLFGVTGETNLDKIAAALSRPDVAHTPALFGMVLVMVALGFKVAAVPFQLWIPDVYQGAPTPVTAFLSVGSKAAGFVVLLRVLRPFFLYPEMQRLIVVLAALTLLYGNLAALPQKNLKRLLAYSSIAHAGYLLVGVTCLAGTAVAFYLVSYLLMTLLAFAVIVLVADRTGSDDIQDFNGLGRRAPFLAFSLLVAMLSLAGLPFTAGFFGKLFIFDAALQHREYLLVAIGVVTVGCGFYYYLKVVRAMYWQPIATDLPQIRISPLSRAALAGMILAIFFLGIDPNPIWQALRLQPLGIEGVAQNASF